MDDEAVVEKRLVEVAEVEVELEAVKFCKVVEPITNRSPEPLMVVVAEVPILKELPVKTLANKLVEVAEVEVDLVMLLKMLAPVQVKASVASTENDPEAMLMPLPPVA